MLLWLHTWVYLAGKIIAAIHELFRELSACVQACESYVCLPNHLEYCFILFLNFRFRFLVKQKSPGFDHRAFVLLFTVSLYLLLYVFTKVPKHTVRAKQRMDPLYCLICVFVGHFFPAFLFDDAKIQSINSNNQIIYWKIFFAFPKTQW